MARIVEHLAKYALYHDKQLTRIAHFIGVPLLIFALFIPLSWLHFGINEIAHFNIGWLTLIALALYYCRYSILLALTCAVLFFVVGIIGSIFSYYTPNWFGFWACLIAFGVSVLLLTIGDLLEKQRPALTEDAHHLTLLPLLALTHLAFACHLFKGLQIKVQSEVDRLSADK